MRFVAEYSCLHQIFHLSILPSEFITNQICYHDSHNKVGENERTNRYEYKEKESSTNVVRLSNILQDT